MKHARSVQLIPDEFEHGLRTDLVRQIVGVTLDDLHQWEKLGAKCSVCMHEAWLDQAELHRRFGVRPLIALQPLLQCERCGNQAGNRFIMGRMARD